MADVILRGADVILTMDDALSRLRGVDIHLSNGVIVAIGPNLACIAKCNAKLNAVVFFTSTKMRARAQKKKYFLDI